VSIKRLRNRQLTNKQLRRLPFYVLIAVAAVTTAVFIPACFAMNGGFDEAWEILVGIKSPFEHASGFGFALSALGYIAIPTVIGAAAGAAITLFTSKRLTTVEEAVSDIRKWAKTPPPAKPVDSPEPPGAPPERPSQ
jgi:hypothetical protein